MAGKPTNKYPYLIRILIYCSILTSCPAVLAYQFSFFESGPQKVQSQTPQNSLVRVTIISKFRGPKDTVEINGKRFTDYSPLIIQSLSATGIVLDQKGTVMTFLGYRWLDIQNRDPLIEVSGDGKKWRGKLVGIDQRNRIAVIRMEGGSLRKTPTCNECDVRDGTTVMVPVPSELSRLRRAQVVSIGAAPATPDTQGWIITVDRPFPNIGQPILTADHRVMGFIASQDPMGIRNTVYPIAPLIASAEKILKTGGDIRAGWLGLYVVDSNPVIGPGVLVQQVEPDSPAQKAGFSPGDFLLKFNGEQLADSYHYVQLVEGSAIGSRAKIDIIRRGNPLTVNAQIEARKFPPLSGRFPVNLPEVFGLPLADILPPAVPHNQRLLIGVDTIFIEPQLAESLSIPAQNGLLVLDVQKNSPADRAGILAGDVILSIDGQPIVDAFEFLTFLESHNWGAHATLQINRKGTDLTVPVQISE